MGWEKPAGYVPPSEQRDAEEAARKMAERRELVDRQSAALADAIHDGFAMVAAAIVAASGYPIDTVIERYNHARFGPDEDNPTPPPAPPEPSNVTPPVDDGIDELLDDDAMADGVVDAEVVDESDCTCTSVLTPDDPACPVHGNPDHPYGG